MQAVEGILAPARRSHGAAARWRGVRRAVLAGLFAMVVGLGGSAACSRADAPTPGGDGAASRAPETVDPVSEAEQTASIPAAETPAARPSGTVPPLSSPEHERYQQLRLEALRLMIQAAQRALPIGPFQQRIDAAARTALQDVSAAGDLQEAIVVDLREAIAAAEDR